MRPISNIKSMIFTFLDMSSPVQESLDAIYCKDVEQIIAQCEQMSQRKGKILSALRVDFIQILATDESISLKMRDHL